MTPLTSAGVVRFSRRAALLAASSTLAAWVFEPARADVRPALEVTFADIEPRCGGRLGVAVVDATGRTLASHRGDERFPLCSTGKAMIVAATLARIDAGDERLDRAIAIAPQDLLAYAPVARTRVGEGMTIEDLCDAAITISDNTAANKLVEQLGGPAEVTRYLRGLGDETTRLDRLEPDLNEATPGDPRDTTTPLAFARSFFEVTTGSTLSAASRERLVAWLIGCKTGAVKLRAGFPADWRVGDKTGAGQRGASNDVAIVWPKGGAPVVVTAYIAETAASDADKNACHAAVGRAVAQAFAG